MSPQPQQPSGSIIPSGWVVGALVVVALLFVGCTTTYISPGHVGVIIHKTGGGVDSTALLPGFHTRNPITTQIEEYPTKMETVILAKSPKEGSSDNEEINVNSKEGQPISVDVSLSFVLDPRQAPVIYSTFKSDIETIERTYIKQAVRQALQQVVGGEAVVDVIGPKKAEITARTRASIDTALKRFIDVQQFTVNEVRYSASISQAIDAKNKMQQEALTAQTELQKTSFNAQRDSIEAAGKAKAILAVAKANADATELTAKANADAANLLSRAGNVESQLQMKQLQNAAAAIDKWNGELPSQMLGTAPVPFLNVIPSGTTSKKP